LSEEQRTQAIFQKLRPGSKQTFAEAVKDEMVTIDKN